MTEKKKISFDIKPKAGVTANVAVVDWPTDVRGVTTDLRKTLRSTAQQINGDAARLKLVLETLSIGLGMFKAKFIDDKKKLARKYEEGVKREEEAKERRLKEAELQLELAEAALEEQAKQVAKMAEAIKGKE